MNSHPLDNPSGAIRDRHIAAYVARHSLFWLVVANAVGVLLATLLIIPALNAELGEWTYGRWMMVHMNFELYGWTSIPIVGFLFLIYKADRSPLAEWCGPMLRIWSAVLGIGAFSWLTGHSTGKLFLDWSGYARSIFVSMLLALWVFLFTSLVKNRQAFIKQSFLSKFGRITGLAILLVVPLSIYIVSGSSTYPAVNPASGGPTAASQLESTLAIVLILLLLPFGLAPRKQPARHVVAASWIVLLVESILCAALGRGDVSHHHVSQFLSLGSVLIWTALVPAYYASFEWNRNTRLWRIAFQWWWAALVITGWIFFLPGVLDHFKFTDGLVGHSFVAMAGFTSSFIIFVMVQMLGDDGWIFNRMQSFYLWQSSVIAYIVLMTVAGWREGFDPTFTIVPGTLRNVLYTLRLVSGILMLVASADWLNDSSALINSFAESWHLLRNRVNTTDAETILEKR